MNILPSISFSLRPSTSFGSARLFSAFQLLPLLQAAVSTSLKNFASSFFLSAVPIFLSVRFLIFHELLAFMHLFIGLCGMYGRPAFFLRASYFSLLTLLVSGSYCFDSLYFILSCKHIFSLIFQSCTSFILPYSSFFSPALPFNLYSYMEVPFPSLA